VADYTTIRYDVDDPVAVITLDRPDRLNALTYEMLREIRDAIERAAADPAVVGIIVTGAGRGFCAGLDAEVLARTTSSAAAGSTDTASGDELPGMFTYLLEIPKPIVAAVNGVAAGGGFVLTVMCDIRFMSDDATYTSIFSKRGLIAEHGTSWIVPRLLGAGRALDLLWSSRKVGAEEAVRIGLAEFVVPADELLDRACDYVRELAAVASPASLRDTKALVYRQLGLGYPEALRETEPVQWAAVGSPDATEGVRSYLERRPPAFERIPKRNSER
jgi:enoyl-CoA hydratase/carnithine racemase